MTLRVFLKTLESVMGSQEVLSMIFSIFVETNIQV